MSNKLTDKEIKKALECCAESGDFTKTQDEICSPCPYCNCGDCTGLLKANALDLINRLEARIETLNAENEALRMGRKNECQPFINFLNDLVKEQKETIDKQEAEIKRLQNAYKQCAWERDIFAEDMKEEIKKDCSYLMLDIKTIKAEAYKECIEKVKEHSNKMELVCSGALVRTDYTITKKSLDNLLKEFERKENTIYDD